MDDWNGKKPARANPAPNQERRKVSRVVHDSRGNASVEWVDAPANQERTVFEIEGERSTASRTPGGYNPYDRSPGQAPRAPTTRTSNTTRTDLRKLSEWIKLMRALEEKKRNGSPEDGES